jgi:hypothetical protein
MRLPLFAVTFATMLVSAAACRSGTPLDARNRSTRPPDPTGCYVRVFDSPEYRGAEEYINGPIKLERLTNLPGGKSWSQRIRSVRVGPAAEVTVWTNEQYKGQQLRMVEAAYTTLPVVFDKKIASMQIQCAAQPRPVAALPLPYFFLVVAAGTAASLMA